MSEVSSFKYLPVCLSEKNILINQSSKKHVKYHGTVLVVATKYVDSSLNWRWGNSRGSAAAESSSWGTK